MPHDFISTDAPLSAVGSAAQLTETENDNSEAIIPSSRGDYVRSKFRAVASGPPVVEKDDYPIVVRARNPEGDDWFDSGKAFEARLEARMDSGPGGSKAPFIKAVEADVVGPNADGKKAETSQGPTQTENDEPRRPGLKKQNKKQIALNMPPTPVGCEWRRSDDGMNLWRCWTEWDSDKTNKIKKSRYAGHLSEDAWRIMKEYDHEAFISTVGERLRRHGGRQPIRRI